MRCIVASLLVLKVSAFATTTLGACDRNNCDDALNEFKLEGKNPDDYRTVCMPQPDTDENDGGEDCRECEVHLNSAPQDQSRVRTTITGCNIDKFDAILTAEGKATPCYWGGITSSEYAHYAVTAGLADPDGSRGVEVLTPATSGYAFGAMVKDYRSGADEMCFVERSVLAMDRFYPIFEPTINLGPYGGIQPLSNAVMAGYGLPGHPYYGKHLMEQFVFGPEINKTHSGIFAYDDKTGQNRKWKSCSNWPSDEAVSAYPQGSEEMVAAIDNCILSTTIPKTLLTPIVIKTIDLELNNTLMVRTDVASLGSVWAENAQRIADATIAINQDDALGCHKASNGALVRMMHNEGAAALSAPCKYAALKEARKTLGPFDSDKWTPYYDAAEGLLDSIAAEGLLDSM